ncbi:hypothetical protein K1719_041761 [Acacia pycnantha]|nr:hypothetical protein K1719_041761 [Acacia pycnantha]
MRQILINTSAITQKGRRDPQLGVIVYCGEVEEYRFRPSQFNKEKKDQANPNVNESTAKVGGEQDACDSQLPRTFLYSSTVQADSGFAEMGF